jgi:glycosyltransferase involved in cell wall biosynthesis
MAHPKFSIVIATYRRPRQLERCLDAIARLDYPLDRFEVIVVSDELSPHSEEIVGRYVALIPVVLISQDRGGPARARNTGAASSEGQFLLFLDDDCYPQASWLRQWEAHAIGDPISVAAGHTENALEANVFSCASHALVQFIQDYFRPGRPGKMTFLASNNLCVPAERFRFIGGFSTKFSRAAAEDRDFCDRWCASGWPLAIAKLPTVLHAHELTLASFWRQHWNYGTGAFQLRLERQSRDQSSQIEWPTFYLGIIAWPWSQERAWKALVLSMLLCLSQVANALGFLAQWRQNRKRIQSTASNVHEIG